MLANLVALSKKTSKAYSYGNESLSPNFPTE